jgi:hypothetical protein
MEGVVGIRRRQSDYSYDLGWTSASFNSALRYHRDGVYLHQEAGAEQFDLHCRARRWCLGKVFAIDFVHPA